jgi:hypothetical protein
MNSVILDKLQDMKYLTAIVLLFTLYSCEKSHSEKTTVADSNNKFLWTAEWTNGKQDAPDKMNKTVYVFLANTDKSDEICEGKNLISQSVYKEFHVNSHTIENPVWSLSDKNKEVVNGKDVMKVICENEGVSFGVANTVKFPVDYDRYPLFQ